jgi:hypothetical protein
MRVSTVNKMFQNPAEILEAATRTLRENKTRLTPVALERNTWAAPVVAL